MKVSPTSKSLRVLHLPHNVGGHPGGLAAAERELGLNSKVLVFQDSTFQYSFDELVEVDARGPLRGEIERWFVFWRSVFKYDVFHFNFGQKFLHFPVLWRKPGESRRRSVKRAIFATYSNLFGTFDLWLIKFLGKKIAVTFQGDDIRQGDVAKRLFKTHFVNEIREGYYDPASDLRKRKITKLWDKYADVMFALNPDLLHVLPARALLLPYAHIDLQKWTAVYPVASGNRPLRVLHAPSDREVKGTKYLFAAIDRMKRDGIEIELLLVEGLPFAEARKLYESADVVVDQLLAGWYGGFAVEVMALGKPVVAYIREEDLALIPSQMRTDLPVIGANPSSIENVLREIIKNPDQLTGIGKRSRKFVEDWHSNVEVAKRVMQFYAEPAVRPL